MQHEIHDLPHNMRTTWQAIIDMGEIFNTLIAQNNLIVHSVYTWDNITGGMEIVSNHKFRRTACALLLVPYTIIWILKLLYIIGHTN